MENPKKPLERWRRPRVLLAVFIEGVLGIAFVLQSLGLGASVLDRGLTVTIDEYLPTVTTLQLYNFGAIIAVGLLIASSWLLESVLQTAENPQWKSRKTIVGYVVILALVLFSTVGIAQLAQGAIAGITENPSPTPVPTDEVPTPIPSATPTTIPTGTPTPTSTTIPTSTPTTTPFPECESRDNPTKPCDWRIVSGSGDSHATVAREAYGDDLHALVVLNYNRDENGYRSSSRGFFFLPSDEMAGIPDPTTPTFPDNYLDCVPFGIKPCLYDTQPRDTYIDIAIEFYGFESAVDCITDANLIYNPITDRFEKLQEEDFANKTLILPRAVKAHCNI